MKVIWMLLGRILYPLSWPARVVYVRFGKERTRVIVISQGKVLMLKNWLGKGKWDLPGGGLHREEEPLSGASRELLEETGLHIPVSKLEYMGKLSTRSPIQKFDMHCYLARLPSPTRVKPGYPEVIAADWLPLDKLLNSTAIAYDTRDILEKWPGKLL